MDWKTIRKDRLAKGSWDGNRRARIAVRFSRGVDALRRAWTLSWWGKGIAVGVGILLVIGALYSFVAINGSGDDGQAEAVLGGRASVTASATAAPATAVPATAVPATAEPTSAAATPKRQATEEPAVVRADCDEIAGTPYESGEERDWYLENCLGGGLVEIPPFQPNPVPSAPIPMSSSVPPASAPKLTATPVPAPAVHLSAGEAVAAALGLIAGGGSSDDVGPCNAIRTGSGQWLVACASSGGTVSVCIVEVPLTVWFC